MTNAHYFDGQSARLHQVRISAGDGRLVLSGAVEKSYPLSDARLAEPFPHAPAVLYFADGARCEVSDEHGRRMVAEAVGYRKGRVERWQEHTLAALAALVLLVGLVASAAVWGVPAVAERIAAALPASTDRALGRSALSALESNGMLAPSRLGDERIEQVREVLELVRPERTRMPLRLLVRHAPRLGPNALALPDGTIVVTDLMVRQILEGSEQQDFDDIATAQLAGVLAHEIAHIELRHSTRSLARTSLTAAGSAALFGDFSAVAAGVPALLVNMRYSRAMETEADDYAIALLRRQDIPTSPLADLFEALDAHDGGQRHLPRWLTQTTEYVSSHPPSAERSERLRKADR